MARRSTFATAEIESEVLSFSAQKHDRVWSTQQQQIFNWFQSPDLSMNDLVVRARAGTGKTTTIIEGVNRAPESSILVCAFNKPRGYGLCKSRCIGVGGHRRRPILNM